MITKIECKGSYLNIEVSGEVRAYQDEFGLLNEAKAVLKKMISLVEKEKILKILFDCRNVTGTVSNIFRYDFMNFLAQENINTIISLCSPLKIAFLLNKSMIDPQKFCEIVAHNRGVNLIVTDKIHEAYKWLG